MAVLSGPRALRVLRTPHRPLQHGEVRVRVVQCGICDSDVRQWTAPEGATPRQIGHEIAGIVVETSPSVAEPAVGQHVAVWVPHNEEVKGAAYPALGMAEQIVVEARHCIVAPREVTYPFLAEPLGRVLNTIEAAGVTPEANVVIAGSGFKAIAAVMALARLSNPQSITVVSNRTGSLRLAKPAGATQAVGPDELMPAVGHVTGGRGASFAFELTGTDGGLEVAVNSLGDGGTLVTGASQVQPRRLDDARAYLGQRGMSHVEADGLDPDRRLGGMRQAMELLNRGTFELDPLVVVYPLDQAPEAFAEAAGGIRKVVVGP